MTPSPIGAISNGDRVADYLVPARFVDNLSNVTVVQLESHKSPSYSFRKLPSGGRGEYEVVGQQDGASARDLADRVFFLQTPFGIKATNLYLSNQGAKSRMRSLDRSPLIQRQIASLLVLPRSTRSETSVSSALPVLLDQRYIMDIEFEMLSKTKYEVVIAPRTIVARSGNLLNLRSMLVLDVGIRFNRLRAVYAAAERLPDTLRELVIAHREQMATESNAGRDDEKRVSEILSVCAESDWDYLPGSDPLPLLEDLAGVTRDELDIPSPIETPPDEPEIRRRSEHIYRMRRIRGSSASVFKAAVAKAYDNTCLFCGLRAPGLKKRMLPGVDAAHILPYGDYDLDEPQNGIMLCKLHHWAFDSHLLILEFDAGTYSISLGADVERLFVNDPWSLAALNSVTGAVAETRLPSRKLRPNPAYLSELYQLDIQATSALSSMDAGV
jgi:hypothetical protein